MRGWIFILLSANGRLLYKCREVDIVEIDFASFVNVLCLFVVEDVCVLDVYVMNHTFFSVGYDSVLATSYIDVTDMNVLEFW